MGLNRNGSRRYFAKIKLSAGCIFWRMLLDVLVSVLALVPVALHASELGLLATSTTPNCFTVVRWWGCVLGLSALYFVHAFIWFRPASFATLSARSPLSWLGGDPVKVFAVLEIVGKFWQLSTVVLFLGLPTSSAAIRAAAAAPLPIWALAIVYVGIGQMLNICMYTSIGNDGVYYGFKLGRTVPWYSGFPFNVGLRHPQYVGTLLLSAATASKPIAHAN